MEPEKRRCKWRGKRIAWCRKLKKFCDAPAEYYTCKEYEPTQTAIVEKVMHNVDALRRQVFRVETGGSYRQEISSEVKESIKRFWSYFLRARGYLAAPAGYLVPPVVAVNVPKAIAELQGALSELEYQKGYMSPQDYENIKTHLEWSIDFLNKGLVSRAINEMNELFSFLIEKAAQEEMFQLPPEIEGSHTEVYNGRSMKDAFGSDLRSMILEGEREGREVGAMLCQSPSGELHLSRVCWGAKGRVEVADCHDHLKPYGSFHVHLRGSEVFSPQDLEQAIDREELSCIGYMKAGVPMLKCVVPRKYYEHTPETKTGIRMALNKTAKELVQLSHSDPHTPEARMLSGEVQKKLREVEQLLGVHEIQL